MWLQGKPWKHTTNVLHACHLVVYNFAPYVRENRAEIVGGRKTRGYRSSVEWWRTAKPASVTKNPTKFYRCCLLVHTCSLFPNLWYTTFFKFPPTTLFVTPFHPGALAPAGLSRWCRYIVLILGASLSGGKMISHGNILVVQVSVRAQCWCKKLLLSPPTIQGNLTKHRMICAGTHTVKIASICFVQVQIHTA